jgi:hypothetical protein
MSAIIGGRKGPAERRDQGSTSTQCMCALSLLPRNRRGHIRPRSGALRKAEPRRRSTCCTAAKYSNLRPASARDIEVAAAEARAEALKADQEKAIKHAQQRPSRRDTVRRQPSADGGPAGPIPGPGPGSARPREASGSDPIGITPNGRRPSPAGIPRLEAHTQPPMSGKARVHELASELGLETTVLLAKLKEMGEFVKSASSRVEAPVARRLRQALIAPSAPASAPGLDFGGLDPSQFRELLVSWSELSTIVPIQERCSGCIKKNEACGGCSIAHLSKRYGLSRRDVAKSRTARNQCAHSEKGLPSPSDFDKALATCRELLRRIHQRRPSQDC